MSLWRYTAYAIVLGVTLKLALRQNKRLSGGYMSTTPTIEVVADWFLHREPMTHKKLQKLCYYTMAWGWALMDRDVASKGRFEAWVHGPVSPVLYKKYKAYGWNQLPKVRGEPAIPADIKELLEAVWLTYGGKSGNELEALSHSEKPWIEARKGLSPSDICQNAINPDIMKDYYNSIKATDY